MKELEKYHQAFEKYLENAITDKEPRQLYEPIQYIINLKGKRLRPMLTLLSCDFFGKDFNAALPAALAVELFHNFSLMHDDIMDNAPLRRGNQTVHEKWDRNTGILSGDAMLILAYQYFEEYSAPMFLDLAKLFNKTALQVCEGQQHDMDFETRDVVSIDEYINMINCKTAVLLGAAMQIGAIVAGAGESCKENIYEFGRNLGIAFQLQDDYLDVFGNPEAFGKQQGGDIISNKKTFLYITALQESNEVKKELRQLYNTSPKDANQKIARVQALFQTSGAADATLRETEKYTHKANGFLEKLSLDENKKASLKEFGKWLMKRTV